MLIKQFRYLEDFAKSPKLFLIPSNPPKNFYFVQLSFPLSPPSKSMLIRFALVRPSSSHRIPSPPFLFLLFSCLNARRKDEKKAAVRGAGVKSSDALRVTPVSSLSHILLIVNSTAQHNTYPVMSQGSRLVFILMNTAAASTSFRAVPCAAYSLSF